jgi:2-oxoisovalerate dehydrogenase E1 component
MVEPDRDYVLPLGKGAVALAADDEMLEEGSTMCVITYGMGVYWAKAAAKSYPGCVEVIDLRTIYPCDEALVFDTVRKHGKCLVLTEEQLRNSFAEALACRIAQQCFTSLDSPVQTMGALDLPAVPMNVGLEAAMLPNAEKVAEKIGWLLGY